MVRVLPFKALSQSWKPCRSLSLRSVVGRMGAATEHTGILRAGLPIQAAISPTKTFYDATGLFRPLDLSRSTTPLGFYKPRFFQRSGIPVNEQVAYIPSTTGGTTTPAMATHHSTHLTIGIPIQTTIRRTRRVLLC